MAEGKSEKVSDTEKMESVIMEKSKVVVFTGAGSLEKIVVNEEQIVDPNDDEIRVKIKFVGVNFIDNLKKTGVYSKSVMGDSFPMVPGCEAVGVVDVVGAKVNSTDSTFNVGDRVILFAGEGLYREIVNIKASAAVKIPDNMSFEDACCITLNYLTAYDMLFKMCRVKDGDVILMPQAAGGVGIAVIQLCKTVPNVKLIALCSQSKHAMLKEMGVDHCIDYRTQKYMDEVKKISPDGVDIVFDGLNGTDSVNFFSLLKPFGKVVHYGVANMTGEGNNFLRKVTTYFRGLQMTASKIITTNRSMAGYHLGCLAESNPEQITNSYKQVFKLFADGVNHGFSIGG